MWRRIGQGLIVATVLTVGLLTQELVLRFALPELDPSRQVQFIDNGPGQPGLAPANQFFRQIKNTGDYNVIVRINGRGLRDSKDIASADSNSIAIVGSSFIFGWGVDADDRVSEQLEHRLHRAVYNLAIPGNMVEYDELLHYGRSLGGDFKDVVLAVTMEDDLRVYDTAPVQPSAPIPQGLSLPAIKVWLTHNSALYFLATSLVHGNPWLFDMAVRFNLIIPNLDGIQRPVFDAAAVESAANLVTQIGTGYDRFIVMIIPSRALWVGDAESRAVADRTHHAFVDALAARALQVVDLRAPFEAGGNPMGLHFANDGHWNPKGHALAARVLADEITQSPWH